MNRGIAVPPCDDPALVRQDYQDSTVTEYFTLESARDLRAEEIAQLDRSPLRFFAHKTRLEGVKDVFAVSWTEPRGEGHE